MGAVYNVDKEEREVNKMNEKQTAAYAELVRRYSETFNTKDLSDEAFTYQIERNKYEVGLIYGLSYDEFFDISERAFFNVAAATFSS